MATSNLSSDPLSRVSTDLPPVPLRGGRPYPPPPGRPAAAETRSLFRDLADGTAGWGVRLVVTLALAALLSGAALVLAYFLAWAVPEWGYQSRWSRGPRPQDELLAALFMMAGVGFLAAVAWIWSRGTAYRRIAYPLIMTVGIGAVTIVFGTWLDMALGGATELVIGGVALLAGSAVLLIWLQSLRTYKRGRPLHNPQDGLADVRCPDCGYRMVGLRESRCPECGGTYTLDELLARQGFAR